MLEANGGHSHGASNSRRLRDRDPLSHREGSCGGDRFLQARVQREGEVSNGRYFSATPTRAVSSSAANASR